MMLSCHPSQNEPVQKKKFDEFLGKCSKYEVANIHH